MCEKRSRQTPIVRAVVPCRSGDRDDDAVAADDFIDGIGKKQEKKENPKTAEMYRKQESGEGRWSEESRKKSADDEVIDLVLTELGPLFN